ncbi:transposable element Tcb2 transposase [Trichonephila clavipes]|nr:transposable element Tcb2 transposase [Trichonephila clavipes]
MEAVPGYWIHREKAWSRPSKNHDDQRKLPFVDYNETRRARLAWYRHHRDWSMDQSVTVQFTNESRFSLSTDYHCTFIWREPETSYLLSNVREINNYGRGGLKIRHHVG